MGAVFSLCVALASSFIAVSLLFYLWCSERPFRLEEKAERAEEERELTMEGWTKVGPGKWVR